MSNRILRGFTKTHAPPRTIRLRRLAIGLTLVLAGIVIAAVATPIAVDRWVVPTMNSHLKGYELRVGSSRLAPLSAGIALRDVEIVQQANSAEPMAAVALMAAGLDLRGLLRGRLGLVLNVDGASMQVTAQQVATEWTDKVLIFDKGWVEGFNAVSPLPINSIYVDDASMAYVHRPKTPPVRISGAMLQATDLARSADTSSNLQLSANLPGGGEVRISGHADVTNPKRPTLEGEFNLEEARLDKFQSILQPTHVVISEGSATGNGGLTLTWEAQRVHVQLMRIDALNARYDYTETAPRLEQAVAVTRDLAQRPIEIRIDELKLHNGTLRFKDRTADSPYSIAVTGADATLNHFSTESGDEARLVVTGGVMGSGSMRVEAKFPARWRKPAGELTVKMRDVQLKPLNDALQAFAKLDVTRGQMSLDTKSRLDGKVLRGRIEPRITNLEVHDESKDGGDGVVQQAYEAVIDAVAGVLQGSDDTATADASFDIEPKAVATWGEALFALRDAWEHKVRTAVRVAMSDPGGA